jgi:hypothetical protein
MLIVRATLILLTALAPWQSKPLQSKKGSADAVCPWCKNDPALMKAAGVVSHGPIAIAHKGSADIAATLPASQWVFLETAHLRWGSSLGEDVVDLRDRERVDAELARLRAALPSIPVKPKRLDPWLRLHLMAMKGEDFYTRFQKLLRVTDDDFPESRQNDKPYMGNGRFLGEKDKYEVVVHVTRANHVAFTESFSGVAVHDSFRWHFKDLQKLLVSVPAEDPDLREDRWLFPHVVHNLAHACFCGYKHFSFDPPPWLDEGLAQALEKEIEPESRTSEGEEGSLRDNKTPEDFAAAALKLVASGKQKRLAELMNAKDFGSLGVDGSVCAWSMVRFLIDEHGDAFAKFLGGIKGQLNAEGYPTGAELPALERNLLKELWNWSPADFDTAWAAWVRAKQ